MAFDESNGGGIGMNMPVAPAYGGYNNGGFGGDWAWIIILLLCGWGGMGGFGGANGMFFDYPWIANGQQMISNNTNNGFRDAMLNDGISGIRDNLYGISNQLCNGFAGVTASVTNGFAQAEIAENSRQMANMNQMYGIQSALQNCCCENRASIADLKYTLAAEACATRNASAMNTRDIIENQTRIGQSILDKLCQQELDAERRENQNLRSELMYARGQASQVAQTSAIEASQAAQTQYIVNRVAPYPIPAYIVTNPTAGATPAA
jgi:hypothetical protein